MSRLSAVILAGGQSRRMGTNKAFLMAEGRPLIVRVIERVRALADDVVIVTNDPEPYRRLGIRLIGDLVPGAGSLGGLHAGLTAAAHGWVLTVACDMPFLNLDLLRYMYSLRQGYDAVIPRLGDGLEEPLHAFYHRRCLRHISRQLSAGQFRMISFLPHARARYVGEAEIAHFDPRHHSFFNANTPGEWEEALRLLRTTGDPLHVLVKERHRTP